MKYNNRRDDNERINAYFRGDYATYARINLEEGISPEYPREHEVGLLELKASENLNENDRGLTNETTEEKYRSFLAEVNRANKPNVQYMRMILPEYFRKFREGGKTPISKMEDNQVLGTFNGILNTARKKAQHK